MGAEECEIKSRTDFEKDNSDREGTRRPDYEKDCSDREEGTRRTGRQYLSPGHLTSTGESFEQGQHGVENIFSVCYFNKKT